MKNQIRTITIALLMVSLSLGGVFYFSGQYTEANDTPVGIVDFGYDQYAQPSFETPFSDILIAQSQCDDATCTADQCCCLNIDSGAQCCRSNTENNCITSCKKAKPC